MKYRTTIDVGKSITDVVLGIMHLPRLCTEIAYNLRCRKVAEVAK